ATSRNPSCVSPLVFIAADDGAAYLPLEPVSLVSGQAVLWLREGAGMFCRHPLCLGDAPVVFARLLEMAGHMRRAPFARGISATESQRDGMLDLEAVAPGEIDDFAAEVAAAAMRVQDVDPLTLGERL